MRLPRFDTLRTGWTRLSAHPRFRARAGACLLAALSAVLLFRGLRQGGVLEAGESNDFSAYFAGARGVLAGDLVPSYSAPRPYQYPPTLAVLAAPLGLLPERAASALWTAASLALLLLAYRRSAEALGPPVTDLDRLLGFILIFRMAESDFALGNANSLVLAILIFGFAADRRGPDP
jgi:glycosyl transferase family 87